MRVVSDSGCDLPIEMKTEILSGASEPIEIVPLTMQVDDRIFTDGVDFDTSMYLEAMESSKNPVRTAAPSPMQYLEKFKQSGSVFVVTLSSKLSASYSNAMIAKNQYLEEVGSKFIHVFDSLTASAGQTLVALKIREFIKKNLTESEIVTKVSDFIDNMNTFVLLEKYGNLVKNGRVSPYIAKIAGLLSIYPICLATDGEIKKVTQARGTANVMAKVVDIVASKKLDFENMILSISHVGCLDKALKYKEALLSKVKFREVFINDTLGLCTTYAERGGIVIAF
jgi:DegV family protein with EDD domain